MGNIYTEYNNELFVRFEGKFFKYPKPWIDWVNETMSVSVDRWIPIDLADYPIIVLQEWSVISPDSDLDEEFIDGVLLNKS